MINLIDLFICEGSSKYWMDGYRQLGIHSGWLEVLGVVEYTREKYSSACFWYKDGLMEA